jgi:hypothetical protein
VINLAHEGYVQFVLADRIRQPALPCGVSPSNLGPKTGHPDSEWWRLCSAPPLKYKDTIQGTPRPIPYTPSPTPRSTITVHSTLYSRQPPAVGPVACQQQSRILTLILLTSTKWWAPTSAGKWRMGFNSAFKGLMTNNQQVHVNKCTFIV